MEIRCSYFNLTEELSIFPFIRNVISFYVAFSCLNLHINISWLMDIHSIALWNVFPSFTGNCTTEWPDKIMIPYVKIKVELNYEKKFGNRTHCVVMCKRSIWSPHCKVTPQTPVTYRSELKIVPLLTSLHFFKYR